MKITKPKLSKTRILLLIIFSGVLLYFTFHMLTLASISRDVKKEYLRIDIEGTELRNGQKRVCNKVKFSTYCNTQYTAVYKSSGDICRDYEGISQAAKAAGYKSLSEASRLKTAEIAGFSNVCELLTQSSDKQYQENTFKFDFQRSSNNAGKNGYILYCQLGTKEYPYGQNTVFKMSGAIEYDSSSVFGCTLARDS